MHYFGTDNVTPLSVDFFSVKEAKSTSPHNNTMRAKRINEHKTPPLQTGSTCSFLPSFLWILPGVVCAAFPDVSQELLFKPAPFHVLSLESLSGYALYCSSNLPFLINQSHQPLLATERFTLFLPLLEAKQDVELSHTHRSCGRRKAWARGRTRGEELSWQRWGRA